jgi:hypothetical protein
MIASIEATSAGFPGGVVVGVVCGFGIGGGDGVGWVLPWPKAEVFARQQTITAGTRAMRSRRKQIEPKVTVVLLCESRERGVITT